MADIFETIMAMKQGFMRVGMKPPECIILKEHRDGIALMSQIAQTKYIVYEAGKYGVPVEHPDGSVYMELDVAGVKVRWPANKYAIRSGGFKWA